MTVYFQGSELEAIWPNPSFGTYNDSQASIEPQWARVMSRQNTSFDGFLEHDAGEELTTAWFHCVYQNVSSNNAGGGVPGLTILDGSENDAVQIWGNATNQAQVRHWNGSEWETVGDPFEWTSGMAVTFDLRVQKDGTDTIQLYRDEILIAEKIEAGMLDNFTGFRYARASVRLAIGLSQCIWSDVPALDWNLLTIPPTVESVTENDGSGVIADVNETPINNNTFYAFTAAGEQQGFTAPARTLSNEIKAVTLAGRWRQSDETSPSQVKPYLKIGGVLYYGDTFALTLGYLNYQYTWNLNPATGLDWTPAEVNDVALEFGWEIV